MISEKAFWQATCQIPKKKKSSDGMKKIFFFMECVTGGNLKVSDPSLARRPAHRTRQETPAEGRKSNLPVTVCTCQQ